MQSALERPCAERWIISLIGKQGFIFFVFITSFLNENSINDVLKKLYKSGFFKDVVVKIENKKLVSLAAAYSLVKEECLYEGENDPNKYDLYKDHYHSYDPNIIKEYWDSSMTVICFTVTRNYGYWANLGYKKLKEQEKQDAK